MSAIAKKIAQIRRKPERIRLRYVWACVAVSMLLIVTIWIFSVTLMFKQSGTAAENENGNIQDLKSQLQDFNKQSPSLKDYTDKSLTVGKDADVNGATPANQGDFQYPVASNDSQNPETQSYSNVSVSNNIDSAQQ